MTVVGVVSCRAVHVAMTVMTGVVSGGGASHGGAGL